MATDNITRIIRLQVQADQYNKAMKEVAASTKNVEKEIGGIGTSIRKAAARFQDLQRYAGLAFAAVAGGVVGSKLAGVVKLSDSITLMEASFSALTKSATRGADLMERVYDIAYETGAPIENVAKSVQQLTVGLSSMGATNEEIGQFAENFLKLGRIGGKSLEDINGALYQVSQALASNRLQGDEFRAVMERVPLVGQKIAEYLGVGVGKLKEMSAEGLITAKVMKDAVLGGTEEIAKAFAGLPAVWEQGIARIGTAWSELAVAIVRGFNISGTAASAMGGMSKMLRDLAEEVRKFSKGLKSLRNDLKGFWDYLDGTALALAGTALGIAALAKAVPPLILALTAADSALWKLTKRNAFILLMTAGVLAAQRIIANWDLVKVLFTVSLPKWLLEARLSFLEWVQETLPLWDKLATTLNKALPEDVDGGFTVLADSIKDVREQIDALGKQERVRWAGLDASAKDVALTAEEINSILQEVTVSTQRMESAFKGTAKTFRQEFDPMLKLRDSLMEIEASVKFDGLQEDIARQLKANRIQEFLEKQFKVSMNLELPPLEQFRANMKELYAIIERMELDPTVEVPPGFFETVKKQLENQAKEGIDKLKIKPKIELEELPEMTKWQDQMIESVKGFTMQFTDTLVDGLAAGKFAFDDFAKSVLSTIAKMMVNNMLLQFVEMFMGSPTAGGGFSGILGGLFKRSMTATPDALAPTPRGPAGPQHMTVGLMSAPTYGFAGAGGRRGGPTVNISVQNNAGVDVEIEQRETKNGLDLEVLIERQVNQTIASGGADRSMRSSYGLGRLAY